MSTSFEGLRYSEGSVFTPEVMSHIFALQASDLPESHCIGRGPDGQEIWSHVSVPVQESEITAPFRQMFMDARGNSNILTINKKRLHSFKRIHADSQRYVRWQKIRRRQRRAKQRKQCRGMR